MKKVLMTLAAVLCCAMATTVFTACSDDKNDDAANDKTPKYMMMQLYVDNTEDMMKYCKIEVAIEDQNGNQKSTVVTLDHVDANYTCYAYASGDLPSTFKFSRKVTLKQNIDNLEEFNLTTCTASTYAIFNAAGYQISAGKTPVVGTASTARGAQAAELINAGVLDYTRTFKFDEKGNLIPENYTTE